MNQILDINQKIKVAVITNISIQALMDLAIKERSLYSNYVFEYLGYTTGNYISDLNEGVDAVVILLNFDEFYRNAAHEIVTNPTKYQQKIDTIINNCALLYNAVKEKTNKPIIWFGFEDYYFYDFNKMFVKTPALRFEIDSINKANAKMLSNNDVYMDLKGIIAEVGIARSYNNKYKCLWNMPYTLSLITRLCDEIHKHWLAIHSNTKKCIALDCDNVLWGGVISEDGIEKICLSNSGMGRSYQDFQRLLLNLYDHGVILTICSKNDPADVLKMFREHSEMILKEEHIACFEVNWNHKYQNLNRISEQLNIGLDSIVFIDDSDFEIQSVKMTLPQVTAIKYEEEGIYQALSCFNLRNDVDIKKVQQRNNTYRTNQKRDLLKASSKTFEEYIESLEMFIDIHEALPIELNRIAELTQRTSKCTNGKRYTVDQLQLQIQKDGYSLYSVSLYDRFSDLGLVGVIGKYMSRLDLFSLSCRALGRNVENKMLEYILAQEITTFDFFSTDKNDALLSILKKELQIYDFIS